MSPAAGEAQDLAYPTRNNSGLYFCRIIWPNEVTEVKNFTAVFQEIITKTTRCTPAYAPKDNTTR